MADSEKVEETCHICSGIPLVGCCFVCGNSICYDCAYRIAPITTMTASTLPISNFVRKLFSHRKQNQSDRQKDAQLICYNCFDSLKLSLKVAAGKTNEEE